jgi:hypothetical protein
VSKKSKPAKRQSRTAKAIRQDLQDSQDSAHPKHPVHPVKKAVPLYRQKLSKAKVSRQDLQDKTHSDNSVDPVFHPLAPSHFTIREDGSIQLTAETQRRGENESEKLGDSATPRLIFTSDSPFIRLYHANCFELLDAIYAKYVDDKRARYGL